MANTYGYIRVSSQDQNEDRQLIAMKEKLVPISNLFMDKQSGNNTYETGKKITEEEKENINIEFLEPFTQWNYIIRPILNDVVVL